MNQSITTYKPISAIKLTLIVIAIISLTFPFFFAYIDHDVNWKRILLELFFTMTRLSGIAFISYGVIQLTGTIVGKYKQHWFKNLIEISIILFCTYWFLFFFVEWIDRPLTGSNPADPNLWTFRRYIGLYFIGTVFVYAFLSGLNVYQLARQKAEQATWATPVGA